jgi:hypothetical protein
VSCENEECGKEKLERRDGKQENDGGKEEDGSSTSAVE